MLRLKHELEPGKTVFGELVEPAHSDKVKIPTLTAKNAVRMGHPARMMGGECGS
jgi:hypothetical protein